MPDDSQLNSELQITSIQAFEAVGNGSADDTNAVLKAMDSNSPSILFPPGKYKISANVTLPKEKLIIFEKGAVLDIAAGIKVTLGAEIRAEPVPLFLGEGSVIGMADTPKTVYPQWFGASGNGNDSRGIAPAAGSIAAGSNVLTLSGDNSQFYNGQTIMVLHAGTAMPANYPSPAPPPTVKVEGTPQTGTATYTYRIAIFDKYGGITAASQPVTITNAPETDKLAFSEGARIRITMPTGIGRSGFVIYGDPANPPQHQGILAIIRDVTAYWDDLGDGPIQGSTPPWIPFTAPTQKLNNTLVTKIVSGGGTDTLVLKDKAAATVSGATLMMDNTGAFNSCYNFLEASGGGTVEVPTGGYHFRTDPATAEGVYFVSNVKTVAAGENAVFIIHTNIGNDNIKAFLGKGGAASGWSFEGITFDGGNRDFTMEYAFMIIVTQGAGPYRNFQIKDCEFRYSRGKYLLFYGGNCSDYRITGNYFHHGNSNAVGIGGHRFRVDNNTFADIIMGVSGSGRIYQGAEGMIIRNNSNGSADVCTHVDVSYNIFKRYGNIAFGGGDHGYQHVTIANNKIELENIGIGVGGACEDIQIHHNEISLTNDGPLNGHGIKVETTSNVSTFKNCSISDNTILVNGNSSGISFTTNANRLQQYKGITIANNNIRLSRSASYPIDLQHMVNVTVSGNILETDNASNDTAIYAYTNAGIDHYWAITGNICPSKNIFVPTGSTVTGNIAGGLRLAQRSTVTGNQINGAAGGSYSWGGLINIAGDGNVINGNIVDLNTAPTTRPGIMENYGVSSNVIANNQFVNYGSRNRRLLITHNEDSIVANNLHYNLKVLDSDKLPILGYWGRGDKIMHTAPTTFVGWICTTAGYAAEGNWTAGTSYTVNKLIYANGKVYKATVAGVSGTTAPVHTSGTAADGTVTWQFIGTAAVFKTFGAIS